MKYMLVKKKKRWNDFLVTKPDFFFYHYFVSEKDNYIVSIQSGRLLVDRLSQSSFKIRECESLREQLIREKLDFIIKDNIYAKQFSRATRTDKFYFKDRTIFEYISKNKEIVHLFTCFYIIEYDDSSEQHFATSLLFEEISLNEEFSKKEKLSNYQNTKKFDSNYIKNFKIWGNSKEINYDEEEIFSLENYRLNSFLRHNEIEKQKETEAEIEKQKKIKEEKILRLEEKIEIKKDRLYEQIEIIKKPIIELFIKINIRKDKKNKLLNRIKNQNKNFKLDFYRNYKDCLPQSTNKFISDIVSAYVNLKLIDIGEFMNYSLNYQPFDISDRFLVYLDFIKENIGIKCQVNSDLLNEYDTLDLSSIEYRTYNKFNNFNLKPLGEKNYFQSDDELKSVSSILKSITSVAKSEFFKFNDEIEILNNEVNTKIISSESEILKLKKLFNKQIDQIENQIKEINNQINVLDKDTSKPLSSSSKVSLAKKEFSVTDNILKKNNKNKVRKLINKDINAGINLDDESYALSLKKQVFGCWSIPLGLPYSEDLVVRIILRLNRDGTIAKTEILDHTKMNKPGQEYYKVLAESALRAIKLCQPLSVPTTDYERWRELQLNFDASQMLQ